MHVAATVVQVLTFVGLLAVVARPFARVSRRSSVLAGLDSTSWPWSLTAPLSLLAVIYNQIYPTRVDAAEVVVEARRRAGLSQGQLGARAGVPQSAVSAYERGRKQPTFPVLARLVAAAGFALEMHLVAADAPPPPFVGPVGRRLQRNRDGVRQLLADAGFGRPEVFGSVARGDDRPDSDVDVLVDLPAGIGLFALAGVKRQASEVAGVPVDLVPREGLRPEIAARIDADLVRL